MRVLAFFSILCCISIQAMQQPNDGVYVSEGQKLKRPNIGGKVIVSLQEPSLVERLGKINETLLSVDTSAVNVGLQKCTLWCKENPHDPVAQLGSLIPGQPYDAITERANDLEVVPMARKSQAMFVASLHSSKNKQFQDAFEYEKAGYIWFLATFFRIFQDALCYRDPAVDNAPFIFMTRMQEHLFADGNFKCRGEKIRSYTQEAVGLIAEKTGKNTLPAVCWLTQHNPCYTPAADEMDTFVLRQGLHSKIRERVLWCIQQDTEQYRLPLSAGRYRGDVLSYIKKISTQHESTDIIV